MNKLKKILVGVGATVVLWMGVEATTLCMGSYYQGKGTGHTMNAIIYKLDSLSYSFDSMISEDQREKNQELANEYFQKGRNESDKAQKYDDKGEKYIKFAESIGPVSYVVSNLEKLIKKKSNE